VGEIQDILDHGLVPFNVPINRSTKSFASMSVTTVTLGGKPSAIVRRSMTVMPRVNAPVVSTWTYHEMVCA